MKKWGFGHDEKSVFVIDDTRKESHGKKQEGTSVHYDHNSGRNIKGYQVLQLGLSNSYDLSSIIRSLFI